MKWQCQCSRLKKAAKPWRWRAEVQGSAMCERVACTTSRRLKPPKAKCADKREHAVGALKGEEMPPR